MNKMWDTYRKLGILIAAAVILVSTTITGVAITSLRLQIQSASAFVSTGEIEQRKAPIATSGDNVYIVWFNDKGTPNKNSEVMFKASADGGKTFGNKTNLSNTPNVDSINAEISTAVNNVYVTWWEMANETSIQPVMKISNDNGKSFGEIIKLSDK